LALYYELFSFSLRTPPTPTLFPYTTLFRSQARADRLAKLALEVWPAPTLPDEVLERYRKEPTAKPTYTIEDHPYLLSGPMKDLRSEEHTSELQLRENLVCRLLLEKKKNI